MDPRQEFRLMQTRRQFFGHAALGLGKAALASLLVQAGDSARGAALSPTGGRPDLPHHKPRAQRAIYLLMNGAPSQMDLFDYKPKMAEWFDKDLPDSVRMGQRLTTMTSGQKRFPIAPSMYRFKQCGQSGAWITELLPHLQTVADDLAIVKTVHTEAINHDPAVTFLLTGSELPGKPSLGAWISYGLGTLNQNLPTFVVMTAKWSAKRDAQAIYHRLWGSGFLPSKHQGVCLRSQGDPVLYLSNPPGLDAVTRRRMLDGLAEINRQLYEELGDPEIQARIAQYEMAFRLQSSIPELTEISGESEAAFKLYGTDARIPGTFAYCALMARRLIERGVRFVQIIHRGWDHHDNLPRDLPLQCKDIDQACAALIKDLKQRGLLEDTLIVWGGEFGRTIYCQGPLSRNNYGRDHHPRCFTMWMAGGGIKAGTTYGETDDFSYNIVCDPVHIHELNATILHLLGIDAWRFSFKFQGLDQRLTGPEPPRIVKGLLA
ncbi:MAG: sulfatase [Gemmataceae bacterium]